jgi:very-short-patch-repair endonuclease/glutaredoxin
MTNERTRRLDLGTFLERATRIHGDTYLYGKAVVYGSRSRVTITCRMHGDFIQRADGHLEGKGCLLCGHAKKASRFPENTNDFIAKAKVVHGDTYDYSLVEYKGSTQKVTVICRLHGQFDIRADVHTWQKSGCPSCAQEARTDKQSGDTSSFIAKARALHGDRYDYSKANYSRSGRKVTITCREHGDFSVTPNKHITDMQGCPWCSDSISLGEKAIAAHLDKGGVRYVRQATFDGLRTKRPLPFDFYLPDIGCLIEYNGAQHYRPVSAWGGVDGLRHREHLDRMKRQWAAENGYSVIDIPYTVKPSAVGEYIDSVLSNEAVTP